MATYAFMDQYRATIAKHWILFFLLGVLLLAIGVVAVSAVTLTTLLSVIFLGGLLLAGGVVMVVDAFFFWWGRWSGFFLAILSGLIYIILGSMLINNPLIASETITLLLGVFYLVAGLCRIAYISFTRIPNWGWGLLSGVLSLILGMLILSNWPQSGLFIIGLFVGIDLFFVGIAYIMTSLAARSLIR